MGLISRVSSRTYRKNKKMFHRAAFRTASRICTKRVSSVVPVSSYACLTPVRNMVASAPPPVASVASTMTSNGNSSLANIVASALAQQETAEGEDGGEPYVQASDNEELDDT